MDREDKKGYKNIVGVVLGILLLLMIISTVMLASRLIEYITREDKEVLLQSNLDTGLDLFSIQYENATGEITVFGAEGQKVVAPGTSVDYTIRLRNKDKVAVDCYFTPKVSYTSEHTIPILIRIIDDEGEYVVGDAKKWVKAEKLEGVLDKRTLLKGESTEYTVQWKWEFESGNDEYDTFIGEIANEQNVGISVKMELHTEANTSIAANGGIVASGLGEIIFMSILFILLFIAVILLITYIVKKRRLENI